jgi:hypothetical protein
LSLHHHDNRCCCRKLVFSLPWWPDRSTHRGMSGGFGVSSCIRIKQISEEIAHFR